MNEVDKEALRLFHEGTSSAVRGAMGHLLRNALCPLSTQISTLEICPDSLQEICPEMKVTMRKIVKLLDAMTD